MSFPALDAAKAELRGIFDEAGPEMDLSRVKSIAGDSATKMARIKTLNDRIDELERVAKAASRGHGESGTEFAGEKRGGLAYEAKSRVDELHRSGAIPDHAAETATALLTQGKSADQTLTARWVKASSDDAYLSAFVKLLADPARGHLMWDQAEQKAYQAATAVDAELKAMSLSDPSGGYMVPFTLDPAIMLSSNGSVNPLRAISRRVVTATDQWQGVTSAGVTAEWLAEAAEAAEQTPTLVPAPIPVHKGSVFVPYSYEVGMDAVNFAAELSVLLRDAADQLQAAAFMNGSGTGQPTGITTALPAGSQIAATTADAVVAADVVKVQNALPPRFQPRARWLANLATLNSLAGLETTNGALRFPELGNGRLLRKPIDEASLLESPGGTAAAGNDTVLLYGDFSNFVIVDRIGTTVELIPNLVGANRRPTGQRGVFLWFRTGSDVVIDNAFRMLTA